MVGNSAFPLHSPPIAQPLLPHNHILILFFAYTYSLPSSLPPPHPFLSDISAEQLQAFIPQLLSAIHIEALVIGNISKEVR